MARQIESPERREMWSFRLYVPKPVVPLADGSETEYSPDEILAFRRSFESRARIRRRAKRIQIGLLWCLLVFILGAGFSPAPFDVICGGGAAASLLGVKISPIFIHFLLQLKCPGCNEEMESRLGEFCPECGHFGTLVKGSWFRLTHCSKCEMDLGFSKGGRTFKIRACTHCGLPLDDQGL